MIKSSLALSFFCLLFSQTQAQQPNLSHIFIDSNFKTHQTNTNLTYPNHYLIDEVRYGIIQQMETFSETKILKDTVPKPRNVLFQSLMLPGWGQYTNEQTWKIPIVYGALIGVGYYSYWLNSKYVEFRAAYYNSFAATNPNYADQKFGKTPAYLVNAPASSLKYYRNYYRNERDYWILMFGLTYALNVVDAYIFAQLKDFDVSDNLSIQTMPMVNPMGETNASIKLTLKF